MLRDILTEIVGYVRSSSVFTGVKLIALSPSRLHSKFNRLTRIFGCLAEAANIYSALERAAELQSRFELELVRGPFNGEE